MNKALLIPLSVLAVGSLRALGDNLIVNGDFEDAGFTGSFREYCGPEDLRGWTSDKAGLCTPQGVYLNTVIAQYNNSAWVFLKRVSSISQDVTVETPGDYVLSFDFCVRDHGIGGAETLVSFAGETLLTLEGDGGTENGTKVLHFDFPVAVTATGTYTVAFSQTVDVDASPAFDNVVFAPLRTKVEGDDYEPGEPTPGYGSFSTPAPATFYAPVAVTNADASIVTICDGWTLYTLDANGDWAYDSARPDATGTTNSFAYTPVAPDETIRVVWHWRPTYRVRVSATSGGSADVDGAAFNYYDSGDVCILSALADSAASPVVWTGDRLPVGMAPSNATFSATVYEPLDLTAHFDDVMWADASAASGGIGSHASPFNTVDAAIAAATAGGCVAVKPGNYRLSSVRTITSALTVTGVTADFNDAVVASAESQRQVFVLSNASATLRGLTVTGASGSGTADGVVSLDSGLIENCRITGGRVGRYTQHGSGVCNHGGIVRRCTIDGNTADGNIFHGLGLHQSAGLTEYCFITNNAYGAWHGSSIHQCPAGALVSGGTMRGCLIAFNSPGGATESLDVLSEGFALHLQGSPLIDGCAIVENSVTTVVGAFPTAAVFSEGSPRIVNTIIVNNRDGADADLPLAGVKSASASILPTLEGVSGAGNHLEPSGTYTWNERGELSLNALSLAVDNGVKVDGVIYGLDLYGNPRIRNGALDIGPAECVAAADPAVVIRVDSDRIAIPAENTFTANYSGFTAGSPTVAWTLDGTPVATGDEWTASWTAPGVYTVAVTVTSADGTVSRSAATTFIAFSKNLFLDASCQTPRPPYATPQTAATAWTDLTGFIVPGGSVTVKSGTYDIYEGIDIAFPFEISGVDGPEETVFREVLANRCLNLSGASARVSGITFTDGFVQTTAFEDAGGTARITNGARADNCRFFNGDTVRVGYAGCLFVDGAGTIVSNCVIGNTERGSDGSFPSRICYGQGLYLANGLVTHCAITNVVSRGVHRSLGHSSGAAVQMSGGTLRNCLVAHNRTTDGTEDTARRFAAGVYLTGGSVENCTITDNASQSGPGGLCRYNGGTIVNTLIWGNSNTDDGTYGDGDLSCDSAAALTTCHTDDPSFNGGARKRLPYFALSADSPCINAGTRLGWMTAEATDIAGNPRVIGRSVDIGCYEFPGKSHLIILVE